MGAGRSGEDRKRSAAPDPVGCHNVSKLFLSKLRCSFFFYILFQLKRSLNHVVLCLSFAEMVVVA